MIYHAPIPSRQITVRAASENCSQITSTSKCSSQISDGYTSSFSTCALPTVLFPIELKALVLTLKVLNTTRIHLKGCLFQYQTAQLRIPRGRPRLAASNWSPRQILQSAAPHSAPLPLFPTVLPM